MAFGKSKEPKEPKEKKAKAPKEKKPKKAKPPKANKPKKEKAPKGKKGQRAENVPVEVVEGAEGQEQEKKKKPIILILIPVVVIAAAAAIIFLVVLPRLNADKDPEPSESVEPEPPELLETLPIGDDVTVAGLILGADESEAVVEKSKRVTYIYSNLVDAGKAAEIYAGQLAKESPGFSAVDEEFVRLSDQPDYTTTEGMVLMARNVPVEKTEPEPEPTPEPEESEDPDSSAEPTPTPTPEPEPEPTPEPVTYVHTVRISWTPGVCTVTLDEEEGKVTSPPKTVTPAKRSISQRSARQALMDMSPAELGLPGESMDLYEVLPIDGTEMVDGNPAIRIHIYNDNNAAGSNDFVGSYLMTVDAEHLYRLDPITNEVEELEFTYNP